MEPRYPKPRCFFSQFWGLVQVTGHAVPCTGPSIRGCVTPPIHSHLVLSATYKYSQHQESTRLHHTTHMVSSDDEDI